MHKEEQVEEQLIGYDDLARMLGIKKGTACAWVCRGEIPHVRISSRLVRFNPTAIREWVRQREVGTRAPHGKGGAMDG